MADSHAPVFKHKHVYGTLRREIQTGRWKRGDRLPSEAELGRRFSVSRITIGRAVRDLQQAGVVERRAGSGTFITAGRPSRALSFGLLIPDLGDTDIFEPICQGMMASPLAEAHALLWGSATAGDSKEERAWHLCRHYVERQVAGVFFAPLEFTPDKDEWNRRIGRAFDDARIPLVLLDRTLAPYPAPGHHDLVGIDNRRAGYLAADHLLGLGSRRLAFVGPPHAAPTVDAREAGYREALHTRGVPFDAGLAMRLDAEDVEAVKTLMHAHRPDAIVCANDRMAARLMPILARLDYRIPADVRLVGIDDVEYARFLPIPLTTIRQPTQQIGDAALSLMLDRIRRRDLPARQVHLNADLIVRASCGSRPGGGGPAS